MNAPEVKDLRRMVSVQANYLSGLEAVARHLVADYNNGELRGGYVEWDDINATRDVAAAVVGDDWWHGGDCGEGDENDHVRDVRKADLYLCDEPDDEDEAAEA